MSWETLLAVTVVLLFGWLLLWGWAWPGGDDGHQP